MRFILLIFMITNPILSFPQTETVEDVRDGKEYKIIAVDGFTWMSDNLDFETELSTGLSQDDRNKYNIRGRYYNMTELDSICLTGWRLPNVKDWIVYFKFMVKTQYPEVSLVIDSIAKPVHYTISNYSEEIDLFNEHNILYLKPTGRIEGDILNIPNDYADYWTVDDNEEAEGRTHIHIMNPWTTIHSHKHHLQPKKKKELRKFMVRCIKN